VSPDQGGLVLVPGTEQEVTVTIVNTGDLSATDLRAALVLPEGVEIDVQPGGDPAADGAWEPCTDDAPDGPVEFCLPELAAGSASRLTAVVDVPEDAEQDDGAAVALDVRGAGIEDTRLTVPVEIRTAEVQLVDDAGVPQEPAEPDPAGRTGD
jgi:uncharacterized membrane protein